MLGHRSVHFSHLGFLGYLKVKLAGHRWKRKMLSEQCVVSDFPERQLPCSGERDLRTVMQE